MLVKVLWNVYAAWKVRGCQRIAFQLHVSKMRRTSESQLANGKMQAPVRRSWDRFLMHDTAQAFGILALSCVAS